MPGGLVTGSQAMTTASRSTTASSPGEMITGPSGMSCVNVVMLISGSPSVVSPTTIYSPSGNLAKNSSSGCSSSDGSAPSKNSSDRPYFSVLPLDLTSKCFVPSGPQITASAQPSASKVE